jgi:integrase
VTRPCFDQADEARLLRQYVETLGSPFARNEHQRLERACLTFSALQPGQPCLGRTNSTEWLPAWAAEVPATAQASQVAALGRWWSWLFERGVLDDNVLACFYPCTAVLRETTPVVLTHNLQRLIARHLEDRGPRNPDTRRRLRRRLENLNLFLHRQQPGWDGGAIEEAALIDWFRRTCGGGSFYLGLVAGTVSAFLDYLVEAGRLRTNPFATLRRRYGRHRLGEIVASELGRAGSSLTPVTPKAMFQSCLAAHLDAFVALKRAMGRRYKAILRVLQQFDRFVAGLPDTPEVVSADLVQRWVACGRHLSPKTQKRRLGLVRQFSIYLRRIRPESYVPDRFAFPVHVPAFKAYVYSSDEYRALLRAALALPAPKAALRPKVFYTVLLLLYATGLRIGEALRLRLRDVDLEGCTLLIRESKFLKSRVVPFSPALADALHAYLKERLVAATGPDAPLFINHARRPYSVDKFSEVFRTLLPAAGVPATPHPHRPRVYDVRHTFALTRVLQWYRDGADLQAKLPLLATYMGHVDVLSTQVYLTSTPELLCEASQRFERAFGGVFAAVPQEVLHVIR